MSELEEKILELVDKSIDTVIQSGNKSREKCYKYFAIAVISVALIFALSNVYCLYIFNQYDYEIVSQDGNGVNNYNTGEMGDLKWDK